MPQMPQQQQQQIYLINYIDGHITIMEASSWCISFNV